MNHDILLNFYSFFNADNAIPSRIDLILKHYEGRADELIRARNLEVAAQAELGECEERGLSGC